MSSPPPADLEVVVTLDDAYLDQMPTIVMKLEAHGFKVLQSMTGIGVIAGTVQPDACSRLQNIPGVKAVEASGSVQLAPPDSEIQ
ncbi:MAG: hypothetical protein L0Y38_05640 [Methylococcaceae bacterium]|nr:hypothetical protein [Methylococcaceae bacterium]MCI0668582.1 hypothetical protein [Methylococcaceae bacterium]MCI0733288.1 hypothetical protein [Methylococcaceae bacterium]